MDATQVICDSILESDEEENEEENENERQPVAKLCILKNEHIPETELPLFLGDNVLGRDPGTCTLPLPATSVSKRHATICISVYRRRGRHGEVDTEALVWDLGSMNGTRKGRLKLTPNVRYALSEGDSLVVADIPCKFVICSVDSSQVETRTPVSINSGLKGRLPDAYGEKSGDISSGSKKCVNNGSKARVSLQKTPVGASCLSFEQTPTQPQGTLVPESDSDSDSERGRGGGDRRHKALVSNSESHQSSPTCSTFLSPSNRIVPESEDESPITPSSYTKNRPYRDVSFSRDEADVDSGRQQPKAPTTVNDSEEEEGREEERAAQGGTESKESGQHVPAKEESNVSLDEMAVSKPAVFTDVIPAFSMDSDTDMEGEEEVVASAGPVTLNKKQQVDQQANTLQFQMDSDTDVDEDDEVSGEALPSSNENTKPPHVISVIQPGAITMDSDTDVDDDAAAVSDATKLKPTTFQNATADSADFHLNSDTDVDEEEENGGGETKNKNSETVETLNKLDVKLILPESATAAPHSLHLDSDTDGKAIPAVGDSLVAPAVTESCTIANAGAGLDILSDSDTDAEDDSPVVLPVGATALSVPSGTTSEALQADSDADTDVDESSMPPAGQGAKPADLRMDNDTDVEDMDADVGVADEDQIQRLHRENTPGSLVPLLNCSTPIQMREGEVEEMETQAFTSPSPGAFRYGGAPALRPVVLSSCSDSQEDEDFVVAETQSFVLQGRDCLRSMDPTQAFVLDSSGNKKDEQSSRDGSFQLGLSDSSHQQCQDRALATESPRASISVEGGVNLEDTQRYPATSAAQSTSAENDSNLSHTQAYGENEEPDSCLVASEKGSQVDLALEATQAYISENCSDPDDDINEDEGQNSSTTDTQSSDFTVSSTLAVAETQPVSSFVGEERLATDNSVFSVQQGKHRTLNETKEKATHSQERTLSEALSLSETQPIPKSDDEKSDDEDSILGPRKRIVKPLLIEEEQTQPLSTLSPLSVIQPMHADESQPMAICEDDKSDDADSMPGPRKRKAKQLHLEEEETQQLTNSELSVAETQPMTSYDDDDDAALLPVTRKRKAKPLQLEDETQPLTNSEASADATQPVVTGENEGSDDEDSIPLTRKKKAKQLHLEEEETQPLTDFEAPSVETQPLGPCEVEQSGKEDLIPCSRKRTEEGEEEEQTQHLTIYDVSPVVTDKDEESDDEDSIPGPRKRKAKKLQFEEEQTQSLTNSEVSTAETHPLKTGTQAQKGKDSQSESGISAASVRNVRKTRERLREKEEQMCSVPTRRRTRGENKMLPSTRGRRGKVRPDEDNNCEEETEQTKRPRGKTIERQQKEADEKDKRPKIEKNKQVLNKSLIIEHDEGNLGEEKDVSEQQEKENTEMERREYKEGKRGQEGRKRQHRSKEETSENEQRKNEEKERLQADRIRLELERAERERKENEEKERLETEKVEREEKERLEREEKETLDRQRKEEEEKERLKIAEKELEERRKRERKAQEDQARLEREAKEREEREKQQKEKQLKDQQENQGKDDAKAPPRGRRATRRTITAQRLTEQGQGATISTGEDFPAMRTRSRSNSSNSVSSERSASSVIMQESKGRGGGRGRKRTSQPPQTTTVRSSHQRITVAAGSSGQDSNDIRPLGLLSRSNSSNSLNSEISSYSVSSQNRGRGGRQRGGGRKTKPDPDSVSPLSSQIDPKAAPKSTARGRKGRKAEESSSEVFHEDDKDKADSQQASTSRGRRRASANSSEPAAAGEEDQSNQQEGCANEESLLPKRNVRGRGQKGVKSETLEEAAPTANVGGEAKEKIKRRKSELEANVGAECSHGKISIEKAQKAEVSEEQGHNETKEEASANIHVKRKGRASNSQAKNNAFESHPQVKAEETEETEMETTEKRARGRASVVPKKKTDRLQESGTSVTTMNQDAKVQTSEPQTPNARVSRKRQAPADSSPVAKSPRSSSASPAASGRLRTSIQTYKVLFTGVVDEAGEKVLAHLGGSMAKGVADMNCLVTDKVRRTVKFLCAVAKGVPVVTTDWLEKSGKAGCFLSPNTFFVKDPEQEKKFSFCLQDSLRIANSQPLLQGYEIHVTKSVKPEPVHMKDIISSSGATFLAKMPSSHKPQTVVISCEEDWPLCGPAVSASLPIVTAEFILTGILQQKLDFQTHALAPPTAILQPAGGRGRGRGRRKM